MEKRPGVLRVYTMLFVALFFFIVSASALPAAHTDTDISASTSSNVPFAVADADASSAICQPGSGTPGGWYWCYGKNFDNIGNAVGCESVPETHSCYRFKYPKNVRHSIGPDFGGYCQCTSRDRDVVSHVDELCVLTSV